MPRVLQIDNGQFAIVEGDLWWPGRYDSPGTARRAVGVCEDILSRLQARKNAEAREDCGIITVEDLDALTYGLPGPAPPAAGRGPLASAPAP